jgi:hypothetical protein
MRELGTAITIAPDDRAPQIMFITQHLSAMVIVSAT